MSQLEDLLQQCTVKITFSNRAGWGTGFFVAPEWILTCAHVVQEVGQPVQVWWQKRELEAVVEQSLPHSYDLALLRVTLPIDTNPPCVYLDAEIRSRDPLYLFGYPDQDFPNGCPVTFSCEGLTGDEPGLIKFALGQVRPGMSGSPLLNQRTGKVCGIVKFTRDRSIDLGGGAIPTSVILSQFPELVELQQQFHRQDQRWSRSIATLLEAIPENLPRSGVVEFVGRAEAIEQLNQMLQQGDRVAVSAIAGMGGMGKTELALQYALSYRQRYPAGICWLQARGVEMGTQLVRFAQSQLSLNPPNTFELLDQVKYCWRNWRSGDALLIFDDVTNYDAIEPYLPPVTEARFKVLLTTRLRLGKSVNQLELDVLNEASALALLQSLVEGERIQAELDEAKLLCEQLGYLPLGLELVGRYVDRKPDLLLAEMRQRLQTKRLAAQALRKPDADMTAQSGVVAAFQSSWETLSEKGKQLGCLLSLFAAAPIPWSLVEQCWDDRDLEALEEIRDGELLNLHLLQRSATTTYRLHPLIQEFLQTRLAQFPSADVMRRQFCRTMVTVAKVVSKPIPEHPTRKDILDVTPLIPHIARAATVLKDWLSQEDLAVPSSGLGGFYTEQGAYTEAELWYVQCLNYSRERLGMEHLNVATSLNNLAGLYLYQGRYSEAEPLFLQALELRQQLLGTEHPDVATSLDNLGALYNFQGRYSEAEPLFLQALKLRQQLLGIEHPDVAASLFSLGSLYYYQGRYTEAESFSLQALEMFKKLSGEEHPDVASSIFVLANIYDYQDKDAEAESLHRQVLKLRRQLLGEDHPDVATSLRAVAVLCQHQKRYNEAEQLFLQGLKMSKQLVGENHPHVAQNLNALGQFYASLGSYSEAEPLLLQSLEMFKQLLGEEHPDVAVNILNLAKLYDSQRRYSEAEPLLLQSLEMFKQLLGEEHFFVATNYNFLAGLCVDQERYNEAESFYLQALEIFKQVLGEEHFEVTDNLGDLAFVYRKQKRYREAELLYIESLQRCKRLMGEEHPDVALQSNNLASLYLEQRRYAEAELLFRQALELRQRLLGEKHPDVGRCLDNLGMLHAALEQKQDAEAFYRAALELLEQGLGAEHPWTVRCRENLEQLRLAR